MYFMCLLLKENKTWKIYWFYLFFSTETDWQQKSSEEQGSILIIKTRNNNNDATVGFYPIIQNSIF